MKPIAILYCAAAVMMMTAACASEQKGITSTSFDDVILTRRSVRDYDATKKISLQEVKDLVIEAQNAPSWANQQPSRYYVALSDEKIAAVQELVGPRNKQNVQGAPVLIVSTYEKGLSGFFGGQATNEIGNGWGAYDNGLSNAYLILLARARGYDTLIMGMRDSKGLRKLFDIPENEEVMAVISLGYRASDPATPGHKNIDDILKFY